MDTYRGKNVLVFGLGILGGGVATTNWLLDRGARVTVTDLKSHEQLDAAIKEIRGDVVFRLGGHSRGDIDANDVVVINPDVPLKNEFIQYALALGKRVENEATIFFEQFPGKLIAITGTRGKTTTALWTNHFLATTFRSSTAGNSTSNPYLSVLSNAGELDVVVAEVPSYHLELFPCGRSPDIALITNISPDHLNRYESLDDYASTKANIFRGQRNSDHLVLNADDGYTDFFRAKKPAAVISYFSGDSRRPDNVALAGFNRGEHNVMNLLAAARAASLAGCPWEAINAAIPTLPQPAMRQEVVLRNDRLTVINDTTATSPEGARAAFKRFGGPHTVFIVGGTDRQLEFGSWAQDAARLGPDAFVFLAGSATQKMLTSLGWTKQPFDTLGECVQAALDRARLLPNATIVFSPGAKSFEKFKNEYDRGEQFVRAVHDLQEL